jgi:Ca2+-binding EF-hand superfamily protein
LRACGQNPTLAEIADLEKSVGTECKLPRSVSRMPKPSIRGISSHLVDLDLFLRILNRPDGFRSPGQPEDFVRGFQVFDKDGTGYIGVGELKYG